MALQTISALKNFFRTALKPTQQQFWDWLDSYWHKEDAIPQGSISGLAATLAGLATTQSVDALRAVVLTTSASSLTYDLPAGSVLDKVRVKSTSAQNVSLGTSAAGAQIFGPESLNANQAGLYSVAFDSENLTTIYFSGLAGSNQIKLFIQQ